MAKKKKDPKSPSTVCQEDNESNGLLNKEDKNQFGIGETVATLQHTPPSNHFQQAIQYPYTVQSNVEQSSLISKPSIQWQQTQHQQPYPTFPQPQTQPCQPIWMTQRPVYQSLSYPLSYPYPGFPGPWDPSTWWSQPQQSMPSCSYTFPRACSYFSSLPPPMLGCSAALAPLLQRGTIQPPPKLSQKHQLLWEAQSAENVQLWNVVGQLQSELADYKNRLSKLESNIPIPNSRLKEQSNGQKSKRGRPTAPNNVFHSFHNSQSQSRGRKRAQCDVQTDPKYRKDGKMMEDKATIQCSCDQKIDINFGICNYNVAPAGGGINEVGLKPFHGIESKSASPTYVGKNSNGNFMWPVNIFSKDMGRESFYNDVNLSENGQKLVTESSFGNEEDVSVVVESAAVENSKDEDEMKNDGSSGAEGTE